MRALLSAFIIFRNTKLWYGKREKRGGSITAGHILADRFIMIRAVDKFPSVALTFRERVFLLQVQKANLPRHVATLDRYVRYPPLAPI